MNSYLDNLNWRYATKKFDSEKEISEEDLNTLLEAIRLSPSSYGLQPYHVIVIKNKGLREKLKSASWGQSQITDASHLIVFANNTSFDADLIDRYLTNVSQTREIELNNLQQYGDFMKSKLIDLPNNLKESWTAKQAYLALGNLLSAAASLKIDACPMEGFEANVYNELLGLNDKKLNTAVVTAVGYRAAEDDTQHYRKVRQSKELLFTHI
ncbi:NAD(P)H-dependent oxidoreductase [uncultured Eudoraea sp.]|uniref:NAD(P)H-dependent oxidoreductase n=1 Tax=uncultured Eudoraea sp. TaxID=1035614 RepID=UPI00261046C6|nr:NAD(P)H-dependent oxidoreductase [uncultured Eudoraea sp.]